MSRRPGSEQGSGSVLVLGVIAVLLVVGLAAAALVQAQGAMARARTGADMAALAGATALSSLTRPADPCQTAANVAAANGTVLQECVVLGQDVTVSVVVQVRLLGVPRQARAVARAGPADTP